MNHKDKYIKYIEALSDEYQKNNNGKIICPEMNIYYGIPRNILFQFFELHKFFSGIKKSNISFPILYYKKYKGDILSATIINTIIIIPSNHKYIIDIKQCFSDLSNKRFLQISIYHLTIYKTINLKISNYFDFDGIPKKLMKNINDWINIIEQEEKIENSKIIFNNKLFSYKNNNILSDITISF
jgi:hypothetical protein